MAFPELPQSFPRVSHLPRLYYAQIKKSVSSHFLGLITLSQFTGSLISTGKQLSFEPNTNGETAQLARSNVAGKLGKLQEGISAAKRRVSQFPRHILRVIGGPPSFAAAHGVTSGSGMIG